MLVVKDGSGGVFGAYLNEAVRPGKGGYSGNGECFLWRCTVLPSLGGLGMALGRATAGEGRGTRAGAGAGAGGVMSSLGAAEMEAMGLPPPPSEDTTNARRMTTVGTMGLGGTSKKTRRSEVVEEEMGNGTVTPMGSGRSGTSTPDRIRFKAFPYSGINDYMIFCEHGMLSIGGG